MYVDYDKLTHRQRIRAYLGAMEKLAAKYPNDDEAQIAYAITLNTSADPADKTYAQQRKGAAILEPISKRLPQHPGVTHYLIHLYDYPEAALQGLDAANRYAKIAPAAPHAQHMPSHIYTRVGYWRESISSNIASVKAAQADKSIGDQLHGQDYMVYAHLQLAQDNEAREVVDNMLASKNYNPNIRGAIFAIAASPARYMMERGDWKGASSLEVRPTTAAFVDAISHFARALGAARSGKPEAAKADIDKLTQLRDKLREEKDAYWAEQVDIQRQVATAWVLLARGQPRRGAQDLERRGRCRGQDREVAGDAGAARAGARTLWRDAARARHGQGGAGGVRGHQGEGAQSLPRLPRRSQGRREARRQGQRRKRTTRSSSRWSATASRSGRRLPPPGNI